MRHIPTLETTLQIAAAVALLCASCNEPNSAADAQSQESDGDATTRDVRTVPDGADTDEAETDGADTVGDDFEETEEDRASVSQERKTPEQIGVNIPIDGELSEYDAASVRYRKRGTSEWRRGHPLIRIRPEWTAEDPAPPNPPVEAFAGSIFDLEPGTTYEVEIVLRSDDGTVEQKVYQRVLSTRKLPEKAGDAATVTVGPNEDLQAALDDLSPGDVLELKAGTYEVDNLKISVDGRPESPVYIRGTSRDDVVIEDPDGAVVRIDESDQIVLEDVTIRGSEEDSGTSASSRGVVLQGDSAPEYVTVRNVDIEGVDKGVVAEGPVKSVLVYNNRLDGNNGWNDEFVGQKSWNDDGIRLPGEGNCAFENTVVGFGDSFAVQNDVVSAAVHFYRNEIDKSGDDAFEGDYSTRNVSFYDNYITNTARVISLDPLWGGPLYGFRNIVINTAGGPHKLNSKGSGFVFYNNTTVRTTGLGAENDNDWGFVQFAKGPLRAFSYRNNVLIYRGTSDQLLAFQPDGIDPVDWTYNAWHPDGDVWWTNSGGNFGSLEEARNGVTETTPLFGSATRRHEHDVIVSASPFTSATDVSMGDNYLTAVEHSKPLVPADDSKLRNSGTPIPNITDGYDGSAPDRGAVIQGRSTPDWGADRE